MNIGDEDLNTVVELTKDAGVKQLAKWATKALSMLFDNEHLAFAFNAAVGEFKVVSFAATETVSEVYEIRIALASDDPDIDIRQLMDKPATLVICQKYEHDRPRYLSGIVTEAERGDSGQRRTLYAVTLRPSLFRLAQLADSRIWQQKSVPEIVGTLLAEGGITNVEWILGQPHAPREYVTQFRENTLAFVERILAEEGILYYFVHDSEDHRLVLTDTPLSTPVLSYAGTIRYNAFHGPKPGGLFGAVTSLLPGGQGTLDVAKSAAIHTDHGAEVATVTNGLSLVTSTMHAVDTIAGILTRDSKIGTIGAFRQRERLRTNHIKLSDYSFTNPAARLSQSSTAPEENARGANYHQYDFPAGRSRATNRIEALRVDATTGEGLGSNIHLCAGHRFTLAGHDDDRANIEHFILKVSHVGEQPGVLGEDGGGKPTTFAGSFQSMPGRLPYRPPNKSKPLADGPQIAIVTGPDSQEIYCDEWGRVKVWFPWDQYGTKNENSSCWVRVSQGWAGGGYGHVALPRVGNEVIVDYLDGDPDKPVIVGRTYHATNRPPYALPDHKTRMVIRSKSVGGSGSNELHFEDATDKEEVYLHAERMLTIAVSQDEHHGVGQDRFVSVTRNDSESVGEDKRTDIANNRFNNVGGNLETHVGQDALYDVAANQKDIYGKDHIHTVGNIHKQTIHADHLYEIGGDYDGVVKGNYSIDAFETLSSHGRTQTLMASEEFEIVGEGGRIRITKSGITIEGSEIVLKGIVKMGGTAAPQVKPLLQAAADKLPICEECEAKKEEGDP
jgi:type VI secretion system secreted protein VgrG